MQYFHVLIFAWILIGAVAVVPIMAGSEHRAATPLERFRITRLEDMRAAQIKLIYLGPQNESVGSLGFSVPDDVDGETFRGQRIFDDSYYNDDILRPIKSIRVTVEEMKSIVRVFKKTTDRVVEGVPPPFLSIVLVDRHGTEKQIFEDILGFEESREFFFFLRAALSGNEDAQRTLQSWGCALALLPPGIPAKDVTVQVQVVTGGVEWNQEIRRFKCVVTLNNTSREFFHAPISLVVSSPNNWRIAYYHGTTCETTPVGAAYLHVKTPGGGLWPGAKVNVPLEFDGPVDHEPIEFTTKVLAGAGER